MRKWTLFDEFEFRETLVKLNVYNYADILVQGAFRAVELTPIGPNERIFALFSAF